MKDKEILLRCQLRRDNSLPPEYWDYQGDMTEKEYKEATKMTLREAMDSDCCCGSNRAVCTDCLVEAHPLLVNEVWRLDAEVKRLDAGWKQANEQVLFQSLRADKAEAKLKDLINGIDTEWLEDKNV
jgi:hypothetical protein